MQAKLKGKWLSGLSYRVSRTFRFRQRHRRAIRGALGSAISIVLCLSMMVQPTRADYLWLSGELSSTRDHVSFGPSIFALARHAASWGLRHAVAELMAHSI